MKQMYRPFVMGGKTLQWERCKATPTSNVTEKATRKRMVLCDECVAEFSKLNGDQLEKFRIARIQKP